MWGSENETGSPSTNIPEAQQYNMGVENTDNDSAEGGAPWSSRTVQLVSSNHSHFSVFTSIERILYRY